MEATVFWKENLSFEVRNKNHLLSMDAPFPLGHQQGFNPKEVLLSALAGCAGMDVLGVLKKKKQKIESFKIRARGEGQSNTYPQIFQRIDLIFEFTGLVDYQDALTAVEKSQTLYSGVSAMICETVPIHWIAIVDGQIIGNGTANFNRNDEFYQTSFEG
jgi:putative redox protein